MPKEHPSLKYDLNFGGNCIIKTGHYAIGIANQNGVKCTALLDKMLKRGVLKKWIPTVNWWYSFSHDG